MVEMEVRKVTKGVESNMVAFDFERTPITQIADYIIITASNNGTSDIHFDPREDGMMVRYRIDGDLQDYTYIPKLYERNLTTRLKLLANMNITESRLPQDGAIKGEFGGKYLDMRVSCLPLNTGEKVVIRILDYTRSLQGIDNLGFNQTNLKKIKRMMGVPNGIILITGATGSGKSTTVYSILQGLNRPEINIITVEDPIEMNIEGMNQVQVNAEIGMTFAAALRSILRQDPNVILIGEIRDSETAQIAVRASITGHLVLSTIHTNNSLATIERLLDMDVERYLMSTALTGIVSQRLGKQLCMDCRIERETTKYEKKVFRKFMKMDVDRIYDANHKGCDNCRNGYKGRIAIHEVLELDDEIRNAINNPKLKKEELADMVYNGKTISMLQDALGKVLSGLTSFEEVYRVIEMESDDEDDVSYLTRSLDDEDDDENEKETVELATDTLDEDSSKKVNKPGAIVEPGKDDKIIKFDPTKQGAANVKKDEKDVKELVKKQTTEDAKSKDPTAQEDDATKTTTSPTPAATTPGTLPQVATLTPEQAKAQADAEALKKAQEAAGNKKDAVGTPTMLTAEQAKVQAEAAKNKYEQQVKDENEKKILDVLAKPEPNAVKKNKLVIAKPNITPTAVTELPTAKQKGQQVAATVPQQAQQPNKPQVLVKQAPPTTPKEEKEEKEIPELNISIKTNEDKTKKPLINDSPIVDEEEKIFEEKDKVAEVDINKISKATDLTKGKEINDNQLIPTISASQKHGGLVPVIIDSFDTDDDLSKVTKSNRIKKDRINFIDDTNTGNGTTPEITGIIDEPLIINTKELKEKDEKKKNQAIDSKNINDITNINKSVIEPLTPKIKSEEKTKDVTPVIKFDVVPEENKEKEKFKILVKPDGTKVLVRPADGKKTADNKEKFKVLVKPDGTKVLVRPTTPKFEVPTKEDIKIEKKTNDEPKIQSKPLETKEKKNLTNENAKITTVEEKPKKKEIKVVPTAVKKANPTKKVDIEKRPEANELKKKEKKSDKTLVKPVGITKAKTPPKKKTIDKSDEINESKESKKENKIFKMPEIIHGDEENEKDTKEKNVKNDIQLKTFELPKVSEQKQAQKDSNEEKIEKKPFITEMKTNAFELPKVTKEKNEQKDSNEEKNEKRPFITEMKASAFELPKVVKDDKKLEKDLDKESNNKEEEKNISSKTIAKPTINIFEEPIDTTKMKKPRLSIQDEKNEIEKEEKIDLNIDTDLDLDIDGELMTLGED